MNDWTGWTNYDEKGASTRILQTQPSFVGSRSRRTPVHSRLPSEELELRILEAFAAVCTWMIIMGLLNL